MDEIVVKFKLRKNNLKMNPTKYAFDVTLRKFLGFIIQENIVEIYSRKTKNISWFSPSRNKSDSNIFLGKVNYIQRLISNILGWTMLFSPLLNFKNEKEFWWDSKYPKAFEEIKRYLINPYIMSPPIQEESLRVSVFASKEVIISSLLKKIQMAMRKSYIV